MEELSPSSLKQFLEPSEPFTSIPGKTLSDTLGNCFKSTQTLSLRSTTVDPVKLRILRIELCYYYKALCDNLPQGLEPVTRGKGQNTSTIVTDEILKQAYDIEDPKTDKAIKLRNSFRNHRLIGEKWAKLADGVGLGIILTASEELSCIL
jgi:hypothetical protein